METIRVKRKCDLTAENVHKYLLSKYSEEILGNDYFLHPQKVCFQIVGVSDLIGKGKPLKENLEKAKSLLTEAYAKEIQSIFDGYDWENWDELTEVLPTAFA